MSIIVCKKCKEPMDANDFFNNNGFCQNCGNSLGKEEVIKIGESERLKMHAKKKSEKYVPYVQNSNCGQAYQAYDDPFNSIGSLILLLIPGGFIIVLLGLLFSACDNRR